MFFIQILLKNFKINITNFILGIFGGVSLSYLFLKLKRSKNSKNSCLNSNDDSDEIKLKSNDEESLIKEQLKRNFEYFGEEGMKLITNSFVCVVGIGGVGSHVVMTLIRSGVKKIRVIDYDVITLSSLNRHAFAFRSDVGKLKVRVVKEYAARINPNIVIEGVDDAFICEYSENYILKGNPDYVIDCIDDLEAKCELINFCYNNKMKIISSMGAGGKSDPSLIRVIDFHCVQGENLARRLRKIYKEKFKSAIPNFQTIYSMEKNNKGLKELEEHQKENPEMYRINQNERIRSLPVFASIPAIFGQAIASVVLCELANMPIIFKSPDEEKALFKQQEMIGSITIKKLFEDFKSEMLKK